MRRGNLFEKIKRWGEETGKESEDKQITGMVAG